MQVPTAQVPSSDSDQHEPRCKPARRKSCCDIGLVWKSTATALRLMPELLPIWGYEPFLEYVDRWVTQGAWTQPDPCAPPDGVCAGSYGVDCHVIQ